MFRLHTKTLKQINEEDVLCLKFFTVVKLSPSYRKSFTFLSQHTIHFVVECGPKKKKKIRNSFGVV